MSSPNDQEPGQPTEEQINSQKEIMLKLKEEMIGVVKVSMFY